MLTKDAAIRISPRAGNLLTRVAETPDLEAALWKVLSDYIDLKIQSLREEIRAFETKWKMSFIEFSEKCADGTRIQIRMPMTLKAISGRGNERRRCCNITKRYDPDGCAHVCH